MKRKGCRRITIGLLFVLLVLCFGRKDIANAAEPQQEVLLKQSRESGSTELFTYRITEDNELVLTGLTEAAQADKKNRILTIPKNIGNRPVEGIADGAFAGVPLTTVSLPEGLLEIGKGAFYGCNLDKIMIPASVRYVGPRAFGANHGMKEIKVAEDSLTYSSQTGVLYNKTKSMLLQMPANLTGPKFTVAKNVEVIGEYAFGNCRNITRVYGDERTLEIREKAYWNTPAAMKMKNVVGKTSGWYYYAFHQLDYVESWFLDYKLNDNNSVSIQYDRMYGELVYSLYEHVELQYCTDFIVKLQNEVGNIDIRLYDEDFNEVQCYLVEKAEGVQTVMFTPDYKGKVAYIGFRANDDMLLDYSAFETTIYFIVFNTSWREGTPVTYKMRELSRQQSYGLSYENNTDGSLFLRYEGKYGEIKLGLPEAIDMSQCNCVEVRLKNEVGDLAIKLYDKSFNEIDVQYGIRTQGTQSKVLYYSTDEIISGIGIMACDDNLTDYSQCVTNVEYVMFYMKE